MSDFMNWATIVGGFSGLLSFVYVVYDKMTSGPKVVSEVTSATVYVREPSQTDRCYNYDFCIEVEIGNIGSKMTSVLKPRLEIPEIPLKCELLFPDKNNNEPLRLYSKPSIALEAGFADSYTLRAYYRCDNKLEASSFSGLLELKQIKGKRTKHTISFKQ